MPGSVVAGNQCNLIRESLTNVRSFFLFDIFCVIFFHGDCVMSPGKHLLRADDLEKCASCGRTAPPFFRIERTVSQLDATQLAA